MATRNSVIGNQAASLERHRLAPAGPVSWPMDHALDGGAADEAEFQLALAAEAAVAAGAAAGAVRSSGRVAFRGGGGGGATAIVAACRADDEDNGARLRSLAEQERQIMSQVRGGDKASVWRVCQNLRDRCEAREFEPETGVGDWANAGMPHPPHTSPQPLPRRKLQQRLAGDRKTRASVARTQEAVPCGGKSGGGRAGAPATKHDATKLVERLIAKHRSESARRFV